MPKRRRKPGAERPLADEARYVCGSCGEEIVVPLDPSAGAHQQYVEDCPVCCMPNEVFVDYDEDGSARVSSRME
jgi:DNA replicative helicase MCM subunit Mcm2 (Cdc46/Mcm family)